MVSLNEQKGNCSNNPLYCRGVGQWIHDLWTKGQPPTILRISQKCNVLFSVNDVAVWARCHTSASLKSRWAPLGKIVPSLAYSGVIWTKAIPLWRKGDRHWGKVLVYLKPLGVTKRIFVQESAVFAWGRTGIGYHICKLQSTQHSLHLASVFLLYTELSCTDKHSRKS